MIDRTLFVRAADAYAQAGVLDAAAVNSSNAGKHDEAADFYLGAARYHDAAREYKLAARSEIAAWVYVHCLGDAARARRVLDAMPPSTGEGASRPTGLYWLRELAEDVESYYANDPRLALPDGAPHRRGRHGKRLEYARLVAAFSETLRLEESDYLHNQQLSESEQPMPESLRALAHFINETKALSDDAQLVLAATELELRLAASNDEWARATDPASGAAYALRLRLVSARCDLAECAGTDRLPLVLADSRGLLADSRTATEDDRLRIEEWSVAVAELARRYDQAALLYAAAVRGQLPGAADRWRGWARRVLGAEPVWDDPGWDRIGTEVLTGG